MKTRAFSTLMIVILLAAFVPTALAQGDAQTPAALCAAATPAESPETTRFDAAEDVLQDDTDYLAVFCTSVGPILVDLYEAETPITVNNFVFLAEAGYYNNINFHRVIPDFMAQGGDPSNTGSSGPGYQFEDEIIEDLTFDRAGLLAMANAGPGTNGSQFFITTAATDWLNGNHTIFGEVLAGYDNVVGIELRDPQQAFGPGTLLETVLIVDDPASVLVEEETFTLATRDDVETAWAEVLPVRVDIMMARFGVGFGNPILAESLPFDADYASVVDGEGDVEYSANARVVSADCALDVFPVYELAYQIDAYETAEAAEAAFGGEALVEGQTAAGYTLLGDSPIPDAVLYQQTVNACDLDNLLATRDVRLVGRFIVTLDATLTAENAEIAPFITEFFTRSVFEGALHEIMRAEAS